MDIHEEVQSDQVESARFEVESLLIMIGNVITYCKLDLHQTLTH